MDRHAKMEYQAIQSLMWAANEFAKLKQPELGEEVAGNLIYDLGLEGALVYAKRKAKTCSGEIQAGYSNAIAFIDAQIAEYREHQAASVRRVAEILEERYRNRCTDDWV